MLGIYLHIPFCLSKCSYCDFYSVTPDDTGMDRYLHALLREIDRLVPEGESVDSIYFGGGTPTVFGAKRLCSALEGIAGRAHLTPDCEISMEANPSTSLFSLLKDCRAGGFNRISFGVQSAVEGELEALTRRHTVHTAAKAIELARQAGFSNLSADLMLGIPKQTAHSAAYSARFLSSLGITHLSAYLLKLEPGTPMYAMQNRLSLPGEDELCEIYQSVCETMAQEGFPQYEISNFARPGYSCRHNLKYWKLEPYLGIGPAAHSFFQGKRFFYPRSVEDFISHAETGTDGILLEEVAGGGAEEFLMLRLRLAKGLNLPDFCTRYSLSPPPLKQRAQQLVQAGLAQFTHEGNLSLTTKGFLVSNSVIGFLLDVLEPLPQ